jgi:hypothetical protein
MMNRRKLLQGLGSVAALPFVRTVVSEAVAAPMNALRFIGLYHPHGASSPVFNARPTDTETVFDIAYANCVLSPFDDAATYGKSFKNKILVLEGVDLRSAIEGNKGGHDAPSCILTGSAGRPTHPSIDQFLAVTKGLGASNRVTSLVLGVGTDSLEPNQCISFGAGGAPLTKIIDPVQTFTTAFTGLNTGSDPAAQAKAAQALREGQSVLDFVRGDLGRLSARLPANEKYKLDQHATALRDIEKRLTAMMPTSGMGCSVPVRPNRISALYAYNRGEPNFEAITNLQIDLLAQAIACDVTRFATLWMNDLSRGATNGTGLTGVPDDCHNNLAHNYVGPRDSHFGGGASQGNASTWLALGVQNKYSYSKCARLMQKLDAFGVLDDVGILMSSDMGDPNAHSSRNVPMVLAGGWGGKFRMGRRIQVASDCPRDRYYCSPPALVANNQLLVSVAQAFGVDVSSYGVGPSTQGAFPGLV